ncbi:dihydroneopterin aldolase [Saccharicrinis sp. FJH2]|uniref:dihydroneopterin aldolase n=1 Tax=unclassified Saccharicrinis TaxID=2646859 RepID=UPI0035D4A596
MGIIELENMEFFAFHGCFREEQVVGNSFMVNVRMEGDFSVPAESDNIADAVNYQIIFNLVKEQMSVTSHLLEHVAKRILDAIYAKYPDLVKASVKVSKVNPPLGGQTQQVSVTLSR